MFQTTNQLDTEVSSSSWAYPTLDGLFQGESENQMDELRVVSGHLHMGLLENSVYPTWYFGIRMIDQWIERYPIFRQTHTDKR